MKQLDADIKNSSFHSMYLLCGEEDYMKRYYRNKLKKTILADGDEINYSYFQGEGIDIREIEEIANTLPFFQDYRVIVLEDTKFFKTANDLCDYLPSMPKSTILIFVEKEIDKRNRMYKYVKKNGYVSEINKIEYEDLRKFVGGRLARNNRQILESTVDYLLERVDNSLLSLSNEIEKLIAYSMGRSEVTKEDVDAVCSIQITGRIFEMLDAMIDNNHVKMMRLYHDLLELRESPMSILYLISRHINILMQIKTSSTGLSKNDLARKIGVSSYFIDKYKRQSKKFEATQLKKMLTQCVDTDYDFKQGKIQDQIGVELLLTSFVQL